MHVKNHNGLLVFVPWVIYYRFLFFFKDEIEIDLYDVIRWIPIGFDAIAEGPHYYSKSLLFGEAFFSAAFSFPSFIDGHSKIDKSLTGY